MTHPDPVTLPAPVADFQGASLTGLPLEPLPPAEPVQGAAPEADEASEAEAPVLLAASIFDAIGAPGIFPCFHCGAEYTDPAAAGQERYLDSLRLAAQLAGWDCDLLGEWSCPACLPAHAAPPLTLAVTSPAAAYRLMYDAYAAAGRYEDVDALLDGPERRAERGFDRAARHATSALAWARREIAIIAADYQHAQETGAAA